MGLCGDFGGFIGTGTCDHPMEVRDASSCACAACGVVCTGRFDGCRRVWATFIDNPVREPPVTPLPRLNEPAGHPPAAEPADAESRLHQRLEEVQQALAEQLSVNAALTAAVQRLEGALESLAASVADLRRAGDAGPARSDRVPPGGEPRLYVPY